MSYILDALKKSEAERQQRHAPGMAGVPEGVRRRAAPVWIWILATLLLVNAAALGVLVLRPATGPAPVAADPPAVATAPGGDAALSVDDIANTPRAAGPRKVDDDEGHARPVATAAEPPASPPTRDETSGERLATVPAGQPVTSSATQSSPPSQTPGYLELKARGALQLPDLHLDIHVYSPTPSERFVFINMQKYREGNSLAEGPRVAAIREDGVLLEHRGTSFLLPRE